MSNKNFVNQSGTCDKVFITAVKKKRNVLGELPNWGYLKPAQLSSESVNFPAFLSCHPYLLIYFRPSFLPYLFTYLLNYLLTYLLTPWGRFPLEKRTLFQLVKKFHAI